MMIPIVQVSQTEKDCMRTLWLAPVKESQYRPPATEKYTALEKQLLALFKETEHPTWHPEIANMFNDLSDTTSHKVG